MEVKPGYKQTEVGVIPEEWDAVPISSLTPQNRKNGIVDGPFGSNLKTIHYRTSGIPIITSGYVTDGKFHAEKYLYVDRSKFLEEKRSAVQPGDIVMAKIGERCGASAILPHTHETGILSGNALKITVDELRHSTSFVWQVLWSLHVSGKLEVLRTVGAQPALSMASLKRFKIPVPPTKAEQASIATALSDVDGLLGGLDRLIAKKRDLKQAAMQQLLTGQTRLPGFHGEWEVKTLGSVLSKGRLGGNYANQDEETELPLMKMGNLARGYFDLSKVQFITPGVTPEVTHRLVSGDVLFNTRNTLDLVGKVAIWRDELPVAYYNSNLMRLEFDPEQVCSNQYANYALNTDSAVSGLRGLATGTTSVAAIYTRDLMKLQIIVPPLPEQTAIAEVLTEMDAEQAGLEQRREKTRALKQAMMQELLTGRTRLV